MAPIPTARLRPCNPSSPPTKSQKPPKSKRRTKSKTKPATKDAKKKDETAYPANKSSCPTTQRSSDTTGVVVNGERKRVGGYLVTKSNHRVRIFSSVCEAAVARDQNRAFTEALMSIAALPSYSMLKFLNE